MDEVTKNITGAYLQVLRGKTNLDEAKKLDPVDSKELKGTHAQRKDRDIDNDGDVDSSDEYLHNRRKVIAKAVKKESFDPYDYTLEEMQDFITSEEFEQIAELSRATIKSYASKAWKDATESFDQLDEISKAGLDSYYKAASKDLEKRTGSLKKTDSGTDKIRSRLKYATKARYKSDRMKEEVELDEMKQPFVVVDTADDNKVVAMASDEQGAKRSVNSAERPPMSIPDKKTLKIVKTNKKQFIGRALNEQSTANYGPKDDTRDTWDKQLSARKGEKDFVDMHKIETPEYVDAYSVNPKTFKALRMSVSNPKRRWNDQNIGDKKPVPNDGK